MSGARTSFVSDEGDHGEGRDEGCDGGAGDGRSRSRSVSPRVSKVGQELIDSSVPADHTWTQTLGVGQHQLANGSNGRQRPGPLVPRSVRKSAQTARSGRQQRGSGPQTSQHDAAMDVRRGGGKYRGDEFGGASSPPNAEPGVSHQRPSPWHWQSMAGKHEMHKTVEDINGNLVPILDTADIEGFEKLFVEAKLY